MALSVLEKLPRATTNFAKFGVNIMNAPDSSNDAGRESSGKELNFPVARLIGFHPRTISEGCAVATLTTGPQHANPMGTLHGGILCDIADAAMGVAFASMLKAGQSFTTIELKINFFRPVWEAQLKAEAKVVRRGSTLGYVECEVTDEQGRLVAKAASTCMVLDGKSAQGR
jgi:uncharacterized protein (TIGR00369 family)